MTRSPLAGQLAAVVREAYARGWALGTSGNFSAVLGRDPLRLLITPSGADKGAVQADDLLEIDAEGRALRGTPSAETAVHLAIVAVRGAGAVLHTHSPWSTLLSDAHASAGGLMIEGLEMLKGLAGVRTHEHREWLPIVPNTQDWEAGSRDVEAALARHPDAHAFLIRGHGLYTWGVDLAEARRHLEVLEFLLEVVGRRGGAPWPR